jgi:Uncharacterized protein conserved in bacteria
LVWRHALYADVGGNSVDKYSTLKLIEIKTDKGTIYQCSCCGQVYDELPLTFGNDFPDYYFSIPPDERETRIEIKESLCVVDDKHFFHRGRLTIPIVDHDDDLVFNVWTSISEDNFVKRNDLWNIPDRVNEEPYFGWLQTTIPTYGQTLNLKTIAIENEVGLIPTIQIIEDEHPLTVDQEKGITFNRALQIVDFILTGGHEQTSNNDS